jgi:hypothetical protein
MVDPQNIAPANTIVETGVDYRGKTGTSCSTRQTY